MMAQERCEGKKGKGVRVAGDEEEQYSVVRD